MTTISIASARSARSARPSLEQVARASESRRAFHDKVLDGVREFLEAHAMRGKTGPRDFYQFEKELHARLMEAEREIVGDVMAASDVDADAIEIDGVSHRRVLKSAETYMTAAGAVRVERWLYKDRRNPEAHAIAAMDRRLGIIEGFWTPRAAEQAAWVVTQMTPQKAENLFERIGNMEPSKSSLDRLPKATGDRWEDDREGHEQVLREALVVPEGTRSIAVSLDGVLGPIEGGQNPTTVRNAAASEGRLSKGPAGYREIGCATLSFCDDKGDLISAIRFGRGPEHKKVALKERGSARAARSRRPAASSSVAPARRSGPTAGRRRCPRRGPTRATAPPSARGPVRVRGERPAGRSGPSLRPWRKSTRAGDGGRNRGAPRLAAAVIAADRGETLLPWDFAAATTAATAESAAPAAPAAAQP
jgi:hypothetical protein